MATHPLLPLDSLAPWLESLGLSGDCQLEPIPGGGNNLAYRVKLASQTMFLKIYRDRTRAEREFIILELFARHGLLQVPRPIALHPEQAWALHQFVSAHKPETQDLSRGVQESRAFLQRLREIPKADVPIARDAFTDYEAHLDHVRQRIETLSAQQLKPALERAYQMDRPAAPDSKDFWVSPSDFGFHNALVRSDGSFCFVDFEYAGLDESSKLICDLFCQPQLPAPLESWGEFLKLLSPAACQRLPWMWQVTTLKWSCIILKRTHPQPGLAWLQARQQQVLDLMGPPPW